MRPKHAIAVSLISATTIVVFKWSTDVFGGAKTARSRGSGAAGPVGGVVRTVDYMDDGPADFVDAARMVIPATVHVVAKGKGALELVESIYGSGAIVSDDGYIVTNNHVIAGASKVSVTLNNRQTLPARVIGADPNTDLAVLKIDAANLPFLLYGNSDELKVGQWVLAVGYPLTLQVTATAGIISGMGRTLEPAQYGVSREGQRLNRIDSFIQTDAAVNLGNSGGPLVNPAGQIVGINTAMASPNGAYTGYSFAIPVNVVRRVVNELIAHDSAQ